MTSSAWPRSSRADLALCGSHAGVSIGEDGPSQMGLEDIAAMRAVFGSTVLYPCDANQTARLGADGRHSPASPTSARPARRHRSSTAPTRSSSWAAAACCAVGRRTRSRSSPRASPCARRWRRPTDWPQDGTRARVIDLYSVKPLDSDDAASPRRGDDRPGAYRRGPLARRRPGRGGIQRRSPRPAWPCWRARSRCATCPIRRHRRRSWPSRASMATA